MNIKEKISEYYENSKRSMTAEKKLFPYVFNSWRAILYTNKGKIAGVSDEWRNFRTFYIDVIDTYRPGLRLRRLSKDDIFSKTNFIWISDSDLFLLEGDLIKIDIDGEIKSIKEWASVSGRTASSIKSRYYKYKEYTNREIVYGKLSKSPNIIKSISIAENIRAKVSKMCSSYRIKDLKKGLEYDLCIDWFLENIAYKNCIYCGDTENIGCDRVDNSIGHTKTNVIPCCYTCNVVRNNLFTVEEMKELGKSIAIIKSKREK